MDIELDSIIIANFVPFKIKPQPDCKPTAGSVKKQQCEWIKNIDIMIHSNPAIDNKNYPKN